MPLAILPTMPKSTRILLAVFGGLLLTNFFIWQTALSGESVNNDELKVYFLDIGQGDATLIEAPNGNQVLIDGGRTDNKVLRELGEVMSPLDKEIDVVIATHPDADHIGGFPEVLSRYKTGNYIESGNLTKDTQVIKNLDKVLENIKIPRILAKRGMKIVLDQEKQIYLDILYPDRDVTNVESNDASIIAKLVYGNTCFIMSGDAPQKIERYVSNIEKENLDCEVLKTGHHGSRTSTSPEWVGFVSPEYAVISAGKNNSYGHPHKEVLQTLEKFGVEILRTDLMGRVKMVSDGEMVSVK